MGFPKLLIYLKNLSLSSKKFQRKCAIETFKNNRDNKDMNDQDMDYFVSIVLFIWII